MATSLLSLRLIVASVCAALLLLLAGRPAAAQVTADSLAPAPGARVRVIEVRPPQRLPFRIGTLLHLSSDSLAFRWRVADQEIRLPLDSVRRLEVSRGSPGTHARTGAVTMSLVGALGAFAYLSILEASGFTSHSELERAGLSLVVALPAGVLGTLIGYLIPRAERWEAVPLHK